MAAKRVLNQPEEVPASRSRTRGWDASTGAEERRRHGGRGEWGSAFRELPRTLRLSHPLRVAGPEAEASRWRECDMAFDSCDSETGNYLRAVLDGVTPHPPASSELSKEPNSDAPV